LTDALLETYNHHHSIFNRRADLSLEVEALLSLRKAGDPDQTGAYVFERCRGVRRRYSARITATARQSRGVFNLRILARAMFGTGSPWRPLFVIQPDSALAISTINGKSAMLVIINIAPDAA